MGTKKRWRITHEIAVEDALKCTTRTEFAEKYSGSWRRLSNEGFYVLDKACAHMTGYTQWSLVKVVKLARTCKTRGEFKKKHNEAWLHMQAKQLQYECYEHMGPPEIKGRKKSQKTKDKLLLQNNCAHNWKELNHRWGVYKKCLKCKKAVKKTEAELIADLIKSKIAGKV